MEELRVYHGRPADLSGRIPQERDCYDLLDRLGISFQRTDHAPTATMEVCKEIDAVLELDICKNLFLCNRNRSRYYLLLMPGDKPFRTKELSSQIGSTRLSFGKPEDMERLLRLTPGSVSVMGLMYDQAGEVQLLIDADVLALPAFGCHPCINTSSIKMSIADFQERLLPALGHVPVIVHL